MWPCDMRTNMYVGYVVRQVMILAIAAPIWAQETPPSYSEVLKKAATMCPTNQEGVTYLLLPNTGWYPPGPQSVRIPGLVRSDAVPFLIQVLQKGPDWADEDLPEGREIVSRYLARCYAALSLGNIGDARALDPLLAVLADTNIPPYEWKHPVRKGEYNLRRCAAFALGGLGDRRAVGPLVRAMQEEGFVECIYALARLRAAETVPSIIAAASDRHLFSADVHQCLEYMSKTKFHVRRMNAAFGVEEFPDAGETPYPEVYGVLWRHWTRVGDAYAKKYVEKYYPQWKAALRDAPNDTSLQNALQVKMLEGGVAAIPHLMARAREGDNDAVRPLMTLTGDSRLKSMKTAECLQWWEGDKGKWQVIDPNERKGK